MQPILPRLSRKQRLSCICSTWPKKRVLPSVSTFTNTDSMEVKGSPGRKSVSLRPARTTRISPCRWHCWQTASRSAGFRLAGFTMFGRLVTDLLGFPDMQLARAVAPLAADRVPLEDRLPVPVLGPFHVVELVRVTEQASGFDESLEMEVVFLVAGGQVPLSASWNTR